MQLLPKTLLIASFLLTAQLCAGNSGQSSSPKDAEVTAKQQSTATAPVASSPESKSSQPNSPTAVQSQQVSKEAAKPPQYRPAAGPISQYNGQFIQKPAYNLRSPLPSSSLSFLMNSLFSPFTRKMTRRSGKIGSLDQSSIYNSIPGAGSSMEYNLGNLNALNEAIGNAMLTMNGMPLSPSAQSTLTNQITSFVNSNLGKSGKKIFDIPKQLYKAIGEKITGASEAAASATVPIKDSFLSTLKSFYSYLKPSRSSQSYDSLPEHGSGSGLFNFKRRQSEVYPPNYASYQQQFQTPNYMNNGANVQASADQSYLYNMAFANQHQQQVGPQYQLASSGNMDNQPQQSQHHSQQSQGQSSHPSQYSGYHSQHQSQPQQQLQGQSQQMPYYPAQSEMYFYRQQASHQKPESHSNAFYQKSKELFAKIARKRLGTNGDSSMMSSSSTGQAYHLAPSKMPAQQGLSSQTLAKVQSKLGTLPNTYNQQKQSQLQSTSWNSINKSPAYFYTQQPSNSQFQQYQPYAPQSQQQYAPGSAQVAGTTIGSSTVPSVSTSTSVSMHQSVSIGDQTLDQASGLDSLSELHHSHEDNDSPPGMYYYDQNQMSGSSHQDSMIDDSLSK